MTTFNQTLRATGANQFSNMPSRTVSEKLEKISEQFVKGALIELKQLLNQDVIYI